jgi:DNA-binding NtrC family response regulator
MAADLLKSDADSTPDNDIRGQASPSAASSGPNCSPQEVNVLTSQTNWDWPLAVRDIFRPRGVNLLVADSANDIVNVLRYWRIRTTIVDADCEQGGLWTLKIIRMEQPLMPCILLAREVTEAMLEEALQLDVFSVIDKPVNMNILKDQLNRLFVKKYSSPIFSA